MNTRPLNTGRQSRLDGKLEKLSPRTFKIRMKKSPRSKIGEIEAGWIIEQESLYDINRDEEKKFCELLDVLKEINKKSLK